MPAIDLSIIIGAYNEAAIIEASLAQLASYLQNHPELGEVEVIVVTADSPDGTSTLVASLGKQFKYFQQIKPGARVGKGRDIKLGMLAAKGQYSLFMDADLATPLHHLEEITKQIQQKAKIVIAVRNLMTTHKQWHRKLITWFGNILAQAILLPGITDTQCGFKLFEAKTAKRVFSRQTIMGWGFDLEVLAIARHLGYQIKTFEVSDWRDPKATVSGLVGDSATKAAFRSFVDLLVVKKNLLAGLYK